MVSIRWCSLNIQLYLYDVFKGGYTQTPDYKRPLGLGDVYQPPTNQLQPEAVSKKLGASKIGPAKR